MEREFEPSSPLEQSYLRAVLFDAGGTLIHMPRTPEDILGDLCLQLGFPISPEQAFQACRASEQYYIQHHLGYTGEQGEFWHRYHAEALRVLEIEDPDGTRAAFLSHGFGRAGVWQAYPEAANVCDRLKGMGFRLGVVSNGPVTVRDLLAEAGLLDFFELVVASQDLGIQKPDSEIFRVAVRRLGVQPGEALYVGDLYDVDVVGAREAGLAAVLIDRAGKQPDYPSIHSLDELIPIVEATKAGHGRRA